MTLFYQNKKYLLLFLTPFLFAAAAIGQSLKGKVVDSRTNEPMIGATVTISNETFISTTYVNLDGSYLFRTIKSGTYQIRVTNVGYIEFKRQGIQVKEGKSATTIDLVIESQNKQLESITISAAGKETDNSVRKLEKNSDFVQNILSQKTIELLPDVTVANALQRMSGVTIQRTSSGEGRYAIIRGMDQRYNNTLVNGIKITSPDNKYRYVPMDIFPSDLLERLEVIKSLTPSMEADAIGGTMNLVMKSAPDKFLFNANIAGGFSTLFSNRPFNSFSTSSFNKKSPAEINGNAYAANPSTDFPINNLLTTPKSNPLNSAVGVTIGDRFLQKKLGVLLAVSYQNIYRGSNTDFFLPNAQPSADNSPVFSDIYVRQYSTQTSRAGIHNKIDYLFNSRNKISLYNLYLKMNEYQSRYSVDSVLAIQRTGPGSGNVTISNRNRWQQQSIYSSTLQGDHTLSDKFKLNWSAVYSIATNSIPDMGEYSVDHAVYTDPATGAVTLTPYITQKMNRDWTHNSDKDLSGYLNMTYFSKIAKRNVDISFGGLFRHKTRDNYDNRYTLDPVLVTGAPQTFTTLQGAQYFFKSTDVSEGVVTATTLNNYTMTENVGAGYVEAKFMALKKLQVIGGVRIENTDQSYLTVMPASVDLKEGTISYTDVLPSVNLKYALTDKQNLRLSYFKSIARPSFYELVPQVENGEFFSIKGNPYLKHAQADNLDARYEFFPGAADQIMAGVFYKNIQNAIEQYVVPNGGPSAQIIQNQNALGNVSNYGLELQVTKYFGHFGLSANYTYTKSQVTTSKLFYYHDSTTGLPSSGQNTNKLVNQTRPLQGQADNVGNLSLLYKNQKIGLDIQIAFVYTGQRLSLVSPVYNADYYQSPYSQLDFSFEKRIIKHFSVYAKVNNLTNAPAKWYILQSNNFRSGRAVLPDQDSDNKILVQKDIYKITFLGGFRYKF